MADQLDHHTTSPSDYHQLYPLLSQSHCYKLHVLRDQGRERRREFSEKKRKVQKKKGFRPQSKIFYDIMDSRENVGFYIYQWRKFH